MRDRTEALKSLLSPKELDGYIVSNEKNMGYFTGFSGGSTLLVPLEGENVLFVFGVNYEAAKEEAKNATVELIKSGEDLHGKLAELAGRLKLRRLGFDSLTASSYLKVKELLADAELEAEEDLVWSLRKVKDEAELALIEQAAEMTSRGMKTAFEVMGAGLRERDVATEIEYEMRKSGSDGVAFETILSSGPRSAFPHGGCGDREIRKGDFVVIDIGAKYQSYCADLTRTLIVGEPSAKQREIHETVRKAQTEAMNAMRAGVEAKEVDRVARECIAKAGCGENFVHSLGHGVGLDVHEPPSLGMRSKDVLVSGNVVTVEPGIYIPKFGGVRIEDTVVVIDEMARKLTKAPYILSP